MPTYATYLLAYALEATGADKEDKARYRNEAAADVRCEFDAGLVTAASGAPVLTANAWRRARERTGAFKTTRATHEEVKASLAATAETVAPVLEYLKDR